MKNKLAISLLAPQNSINLTEILKIVSDCRCQVVETRLNPLDSDYSIVIFLHGSWDAIAKAESAFGNLAKKLELPILLKRTQLHNYNSNLLLYNVQVFCPAKPEIPFEVCQFFSQQQIQVYDFYAAQYLSPPLSTPMQMLSMTILIPIDKLLSELRDNFLMFCDELNIDGILEPEKR